MNNATNHIMNNYQIFITILMITLGTVITRFAPFIIFAKSKKNHKYINFLSKTLPYSMIGLLVIYCIKNVSLIKYPYALPEIISIAFIAVLHILKRNTLLSIGLGTIMYMFLVQVIFV